MMRDATELRPSPAVDERTEACKPGFGVEWRLVLLCSVDFLLNLAATLMHLAILLTFPSEAYLVVLILLSLNCLSISAAAACFSCRRKEDASTLRCLSFYRCHRVGSAVGCLFVGLLFVALATVYLIKSNNSGSSQGTDRLQKAEPLRHFGFVIGGFSCAQGGFFLGTQICFSAALRQRLDLLHARATAESSRLSAEPAKQGGAASIFSVALHGRSQSLDI